MALIRNGGNLYPNTYRFLSGLSAYSLMSTLGGGSAKRNWSSGWHSVSGVTNRSALPDGYRPPSSWMMAQKAGGLSARNSLVGAGAFTSAGTLGKNAEASLSGSGDLAGTAQLIISMVATLTGSGNITNAALLAYLQLAATLAGAGDLAGATGALASALATLTGSGTASATPYATGTLAANITSAGNVLDTGNVGPAVWGALAAQNNNPGTMGEKLNDAGSGSNPWTEVIESGYTAAEILRIITAYAAGAVTGGPASPAFKSLDGTKTRIGGTADADGNRTRSALDGS